MHASSLENMQLCFRRFIQGGPLETGCKTTVLDLGAANVNGSYRTIFPHPHFNYTGVDLAAADGVDLVLDDPYVLPFADESFDIVVSGQALEHAEFFWLIFAEMGRVLKPGGFIFLIAPSAGPIHRYPVDCYRFYPDAYHALAKYAKLHLVDLWRDERGPWQDLVGVFQRQETPLATFPWPVARARSRGPAGAPYFRGSPDEEIVQGKRGYLEVLADLHRGLAPGFYIEIGVRHGDSLVLAECPAVGVDPEPQLKRPISATTDVVALTSDDFFAGPHKGWLSDSFDLAFVDGMHLFEFALRDFMNLERAATPASLIVFDDIFPNHPAQAERVRRTGAWTGDVWKVHQILKAHRPDLVLLPIDSSPAGSLIVCGLNPTNRVLWDKYNPIVAAYAASDREPPAEVIARANAHPGDEATLAAICGVLRNARARGHSGTHIVQSLRSVIRS
ncbi:methyltransferase domain-containing protein [Methylocystis sp. ATCC 49242]|uniref:methyltransferase domain-containing protein n=1 Tax=Methylocystis sp. ATCC 49242 TaxID=622637 RepID=UPI0002DE6474|nr:methyltransferase domain-containing protein [Methylocystis sp. ATCC 49242]